jgi:type VI protein secretion system component Hcp
MGKGKKAAKPKKTTTVKDLTVTDAKAVRGGKVAMQDIKFTQTVNKASPSL